MVMTLKRLVYNLWYGYSWGRAMQSIWWALSQSYLTFLQYGLGIGDEVTLSEYVVWPIAATWSRPQQHSEKKKRFFQRAALKHWERACFFSMQHWNAGTGDEAMLHSHMCTYCACARLVQVESKRCSRFVCFYGTTWWYIARSFWGSNQTTPCTPNTEIINHTCMVSMSTYMYM